MADQLEPAAAAALMECIPPFGWHEIATKSDLGHLEESMNRRFDSLEERLTLRFEIGLNQMESGILRWTIGLIFVGIPAMAAAVAGIVVLIK